MKALVAVAAIAVIVAAAINVFVGLSDRVERQTIADRDAEYQATALALQKQQVSIMATEQALLAGPFERDPLPAPPNYVPSTIVATPTSIPTSITLVPSDDRIVTYHAWGTTSSMIVNYSDESGRGQQHELSGPWERMLVIPQGRTLAVSVQNRLATGAVMCEILIDNKPVVRQTAESPNSVADCLIPASGE